ncbi:MAG: hypothetical protein COB29_11450 [Sulfitobacter sp.]|nr:MAG: hypothetical protein COB29_11450 [Sulfitobacter sp.]
MSIIAPVRSGKTTLINNLLYNPDFGYKNIFTEGNIFVISPTITNDNSGRFISDDPDITVITEGLENLDEIIELIAESQKDKGDDKEQVLIILDDCLGFLRKTGGFLNNFLSRYRHYKISLIVTSQHFKALSVIQRLNTGYYIFFKSFNRKEQLAIEEEMSGSIPDFKDCYDLATDDKFSMLYVDLEKMKCYHNFQELLWEK